MLRPGLIQPLHGIQSKTRSYRVLYSIARPFLTPLRRALPAHVLTTEQMGRVMIALVQRGAAKPVLESRDIYELTSTRSGDRQRRS